MLSSLIRSYVCNIIVRSQIYLFQIEEHQQNDCLQQEIPCIYADIGCDVKVSFKI